MDQINIKRYGLTSLLEANEGHGIRRVQNAELYLAKVKNILHHYQNESLRTFTFTVSFKLSNNLTAERISNA